MGHREMLLAGARKCLADRGYARTTARDLVAASSTNLASIGYHFGSKEALLNEAIGEAMDEWTAQLGAIAFADPAATPLQRIRASWQALVESFAEHRALLVAFAEAMAQAERSPQVREHLAASYRRIRDVVTAMVLDAAVGTDLTEQTARHVASFIIAVCDGLTVQWLLDPDAITDGGELYDTVEATVRALS